MAYMTGLLKKSDDKLALKDAEIEKLKKKGETQQKEMTYLITLLRGQANKATQSEERSNEQRQKFMQEIKYLTNLL